MANQKRSFSAQVNADSDGGLKQKLLHGSDIPKQFDGVVVKVKTVRDSPANFNAPFILDFDEPFPYGCKSWAMNMTNAAIAASKVGDDPDALIGKRIYLKIIMTDNPKTGDVVRSLTIAKIEGEKAARVDTTAKKPKLEKAPKTSEGITEKDLPF